MKSKFNQLNLICIVGSAYAFTCCDAIARGGQRGGGGGILFGIIGVAIAYFLFKAVGSVVSPSSNSSSQVILGFMVSSFCIAILLSIFK